MSHLERIKEAGAADALNNIITSFIKKGGDADVEKLKGEIDANGLKSPAVMKLIGRFQSSDILKPGLYKKLAELNSKIGSNGQTAKPKEEPKEEPKAAAKPESTSEDSAEPQLVDAASESSDDAEQEAEGDDGLTTKQREKLKERMKKEEKKMRERLLKKEQKIRERLAARAEKRAQRLGIKAGEAKEIQELKEVYAAKREEYMKLRDEIKQIREKIKGLRPHRSSKLSDEERNFKLWTRKVDRLTKRVEKWSESEDEKAPERLAATEEKLVEAKAELEKATSAYEEWKLNNPEPEPKDDSDKAGDDE